MNSLELEFLLFLGFSLQVSSDLYSSYHSELKTYLVERISTKFGLSSRYNPLPGSRFIPTCLESNSSSSFDHVGQYNSNRSFPLSLRCQTEECFLRFPIDQPNVSQTQLFCEQDIPYEKNVQLSDVQCSTNVGEIVSKFVSSANYSNVHPRNQSTMLHAFNSSGIAFRGENVRNTLHDAGFYLLTGV
jgi:hypothetical protein